MILFIRNIPSTSLISELHDFVESALKKPFFFRSGRVLKCEILVIQDKRTKAYEFHGLVHVNSDKAGRRAIRQLTGKRFKNKFVVVREYAVRSWHNDRRLKYGPASEKNANKRLSERRRGEGMEFINDMSKIFSSSEDFARKLI